MRIGLVEGNKIINKTHRQFDTYNVKISDMTDARLLYKYFWGSMPWDAS